MNSRFHLTGFGKRAAAAGAVALALIAAAPAVGHAVGFGTRQWTTIGSAGAAMGGRVTDSGTAAVLDSDSDFAVVRYNVVATDGLFATDPNFPFLATSTSMAARFLDPGNTTRVLIRLRRTDLETSMTSTMLTIDSNNFGASNLYQNQTVGCGQGFDFSNYAYFVEVTLSRTAANTSAGIASIQIGKADLCIGIGT